MSARRVASGLLAVSLAVVGLSPAAAAPPAEETVNDEVALAVVDPTGLPIEARLISRIATQGGEARTIEDPASTTNVTYRDRRGAPQTYSDGVLLPVSGAEAEAIVTEALFDKPMPVAIHARYALDGRSVDPMDALGAAGELAVTYTITNTTVREEPIRYQDADGVQSEEQLPVFAPFAGTLVVTVPADMGLLAAPGAVQTTNEQGRRVLRFDVLLAPPAGDFQQQFEVVLTAQRIATPEALLTLVPVTSQQDLSLGFAADLLGESLAASTELTGGLRELDAQTGLLAEGAAGLADGAGRMAQGQALLSAALGLGADGAADAAAGTDLLVAALAEVEAGLVLLAGPEGLGLAARTAQDLAVGADLLADIVGSSTDGPFDPVIEWPEQGLPPDFPPWPPTMPEWGEAMADWPIGSDELPFAPNGTGRDGVCDLDVDGDGFLDIPVTDLDCLPTLVQALRALAAAALAAGAAAAEIPVQLSAAKAELVAAGEATGQAAGDAGAAAQGSAQLLAAVCGEPPDLSPQECAALQRVAASAGSAAQSAQGAQQGIAEGLAQLGPAALTASGLAVGLPVLAGLLGVTEQAAALVGDGLRSGSAEAPGLVEGLDLLADGVAEAASAAGQLAEGATLARAGAAELAGAVGALTSGLAEAADGASALASASGALTDGSAALAEGAGLLRSEGTAPALEAAVDGSGEAALADAYLAAVDARAADALPYGPPEGARGQAAYVLHMPAVAPTRGVPWWFAGALGLLLAAGVGAALLRARRTT